MHNDWSHNEKMGAYEAELICIDHGLEKGWVYSRLKMHALQF